jgi:hypothetical protein
MHLSLTAYSTPGKFLQSSKKREAIDQKIAINDGLRVGF